MKKILILAFSGIGIIAALDYWTGHEISFSVFYLLPIALLAWRIGPVAAISASLLSSVFWYSADVASHTYSHPLVGVWNATVRLMFFLFAAATLERLRTVLDRERNLARTDALTGLYNARAFTELLDLELARSRRTGRALTLAFLDLDRFKAVNDRFGHAAEDRVLHEVGMRLGKTVRTNDIPGRLGGDEFVVLLTETSEAQAELALRRIREELSVALSTVHASSEVGVTASIGAIVYTGGTASPDDLLRRADSVMYRAKQQGAGHTLINVLSDPNVAPGDQSLSSTTK